MIGKVQNCSNDQGQGFYDCHLIYLLANKLENFFLFKANESISKSRCKGGARREEEEGETSLPSKQS